MRLSKISSPPFSRFAFALPLVSCHGENGSYRSEPSPPASPAPFLQPDIPAPPASAPHAQPLPQTDKPPASIRSGAAPLPSNLSASLSLLRRSGKTEIAQIIESRVSQQKPKMRLTPDEGARAAVYVLSDLRSMPACEALSRIMPKTAIEILRSVHERDVSRLAAEGMSVHLRRLHDSMKMRNPKPFDENTSHVIGREWHEIDYSGEGMSWQSQKRFYLRYGITDLKSAENLRKLFEVESRMPYFSRIYQPEGKLPDF